MTNAARNDVIVRGGAPFENLFVVDNIERPNINHFGSQGSTGTGEAYGAELFLQKKLAANPFYGQLSASWSRTRFAGVRGVALRGAFDTPVIAKGVLGWPPNARWEVATRIRSGSGLPLTAYVTIDDLAGTLDFTQYNRQRLGSFVAADVRVDRRFVFGGRQLIAFIDLQNVTNRDNDQPPALEPTVAHRRASAKHQAPSGNRAEFRVLSAGSLTGVIRRRGCDAVVVGDALTITGTLRTTS